MKINYIQVDAIANPELTKTTVSNSYCLDFDTIDTNWETLKNEYTSINSTDITNALMTCGYDEKQAMNFMMKSYSNNNGNTIDSSLLLEHGENEANEQKAIIFINNLFKFRSTIQYQTGRNV
ncbi:unnamed protein product [Schistosoma curassoni]|uniref:Uncharacterized protein n=1 Tax=Schistosoma curassoni TaxID=6186 RepID=A0A3P8DC86_9TREM|nr:unnamed protein product [Schistosoma curassoni]